MDTRTLCLAILQKGAASGYEIKKKLEEMPYRIFQEVGFGSIYPALNRLLEAGHVTVQAQAQRKRPDKKVYAITANGRQELEGSLLHPPAQDRFRSDFLFVLFHSELLAHEELADLFDTRITELKSTIDQMHACDLSGASPGARFVHGYGLTYYENALDYLCTHREWLLDETEARRQTTSATWCPEVSSTVPGGDR
ncbi:PadR family transcriptional regulator [Fodinicurvata fenggangensis]|uniref:PadR family transcriptional regulator n=1 Tax=Fodinicurvata fenggangensis TaxID=1121830 RepID=UPI00068F18FA|nr:PadR family transcriptional regulator [Fodinicurvata fenggangensis]